MTIPRNSIEQDPFKELDQNAIFNWLNGWSDPITFTVVTGGTEVAVSHDMEVVPDHAIHLIRPGAMGQGSVFPGTTAWTNKLVYLTSTVAGDYAVVLRR